MKQKLINIARSRAVRDSAAYPVNSEGAILFHRVANLLKSRYWINIYDIANLHPSYKG